MPENQSAERLSGALSTWPPIRSPHTGIVLLCCREAFFKLFFLFFIFFSRKWSLIKSCIVLPVCWGSAQPWASANSERKGNPVVRYRASLWGSVRLWRAAGNGTLFLGFVPLPSNGAARGGRQGEHWGCCDEVKETPQWNTRCSLCPFLNPSSYSVRFSLSHSGFCCFFLVFCWVASIVRSQGFPADVSTTAFKISLVALIDLSSCLSAFLSATVGLHTYTNAFPPSSLRSKLHKRRNSSQNLTVSIMLASNS